MAVVRAACAGTTTARLPPITLIRQPDLPVAHDDDSSDEALDAHRAEHTH